MLILDCACGSYHLEAEDVVGMDVAYSCNGEANHPDVIADANFMPFKDGAFDLVFSSHTLEHVSTPFRVLKEFKRVAKRLVIRVPNVGFYRGSINEDDGHLYCWNSKTFFQLLSLVYRNVKVKTQFDWIVRGFSGRRGVVFRQLSIMKTVFFVLLMKEYSELEAVCSD